MRTVKIQGGLGNQLFGLAFAHSIATLTGRNVALDLSSYGADRYGRGYDFPDLAAHLGGLTLTDHPWRGSRLVSAAARILPLPGLVAERAPPPDAAALRALVEANAYFDGYWQHEAFIAAPDPFKDAVRADIAARGEADQAADVLIHFRTYKEEIHADRGATPAPAYFRRCLEALDARGAAIGGVRLISDDPDLAMRRIGDLGVPVSPATGESRWDDMAALMSARRLILTNSSFSWWGGYCGAAETVFYPHQEGLFHYPVPAARFEVV